MNDRLGRGTPRSAPKPLAFPGDKSLAHRALLLALLARTPSRIRNVPDGDDVARTIAALRALGARVEDDGGSVTVTPPAAGVLLAPPGPIDCGNSGTLARLLLGVVVGAPLTPSAQPLDVQLVGDASLSRRPMARVLEPMARLFDISVEELVAGAGAGATLPGATLPLRVRSVHRGGAGARADGPGHVDVDTNVHTNVPSAQVKSALILAARHRAGTTTIHEPAATRDHTERMLAWLLRRGGAQGAVDATVDATVDGDRRVGRLVRVRGPLAWDGFSVELPGDVSSAALVACYALLPAHGPSDGPGPEREDALRTFVARDVLLNDRRSGFWRALSRMGVRVETSVAAYASRMGEACGTVSASVAGSLCGVTITAAELPDLVDEVPALVVVAVHAAPGQVTRIEGVGELRLKESDRVARLVELARAFGAEAEVTSEEALIIRARSTGPTATGPADVRTDGDHRIAMAAIALARRDGRPLRLDDEGAARTSFPGFMDALDAVDRGS